MFYGGLALAHLVSGRHEAAIEWADRALHENPRAIAVIGFKAGACGHLGRVEEGRDCVRRLSELRPKVNIATLMALSSINIAPEVAAIGAEGLRKAGLPEE
jgi:hypothetical protein